MAIKLDLGGGINPRDGFESVDNIAFPGVIHVVDLCERVYRWESSGDEPERSEKVHVGYKPWPWDDNSVDEIHCSHFLEHFGGWDRVHIFNEMHRVLKPGGKATIIVPSWTSGRAYGDPTHQWPPMATFSFAYLDRSWRMGGKIDPAGKPIPPQAPHTDAEHVQFGYSCDFDFEAKPGMHPELLNYPQDQRRYMLTFNIEATQDIYCELTKPLKPR